MSVAIVFISLFVVIFGIFYLYFSTRNKERLALIEKGADASIFMKGAAKNAAPFWKILILNLGLLAVGIGVGVLLGALLSYNFGYSGSSYNNRPMNYVSTETFYAASIFLCAGAALLVGFKITKNLDKE